MCSAAAFSDGDAKLSYDEFMGLWGAGSDLAQHQISAKYRRKAQEQTTDSTPRAPAEERQEEEQVKMEAEEDSEEAQSATIAPYAHELPSSEKIAAEDSRHTPLYGCVFI